MQKQLRGFSSLIILVIMVLAIVGGVFYLEHPQTEPHQEDQAGQLASSTPPTQTTRVDVPSDWLRYSDPHGFSYSLPPDWPRSEYFVRVYPLTKFRVYEDPSALYEYDAANKQWLSIGCSDFSMTTNCDEAKHITTTIVQPNIVVAGVPGRGLLTQSPTYYLVPINSEYGILISLVTEHGPTGDFVLSATQQRILDSFRFSEPQKK